MIRLAWALLISLAIGCAPMAMATKLNEVAVGMRPDATTLAASYSAELEACVQEAATFLAGERCMSSTDARFDDAWEAFEALRVAWQEASTVIASKDLDPARVAGATAKLRRAQHDLDHAMGAVE